MTEEKRLKLTDRYMEAGFVLVAFIALVSSVALFTGHMTSTEFAWLNGPMTLFFNTVQGISNYKK